MSRNALWCVTAVACFSMSAEAAEVVRLGAANWQLVPEGKEVDAIYGDYLIRSDKVVAVIGDTTPTRRAHLMLGNVQGAVLDFTLRETNNDQLTAFLPHGIEGVAATEAEIVTARGAKVVLRVKRPATATQPIEAVTEYALADGDAFLEVTTRYRNTGSAPAEGRLSDVVRCDHTFTQTPEGEVGLVHFYDRWFRAAYGVVRKGGLLSAETKTGKGNGPAFIDFPDLVVDAKKKLSRIEAGKEIVLTRYLVAGRHAAEVDLVGQKLAGQKLPRVTVSVADDRGKAVAGADVVLRDGDKVLGEAFTDRRGGAVFGVARGKYTVAASQVGRASGEAPVEASKTVKIRVGGLAQVAFAVTDAAGKPTPCKVQFVGQDGTPDPDLGPIQRADGCKNITFSPNGKFTAAVPAGAYKIAISRGPEYDAVFQDVTVEAGKTARVAAKLVRVVDSRGWVSTDFHNHSTESGDNTTSTEGRIVSLAAEGVEFAPSTEHNRIQSYRPRLKALGLDKVLATSDGIEFTGSPLPLSHHNAFPLKVQLHTQGNGMPNAPKEAGPRDRLKMLIAFDNGSEKLVQQNHPDISQLFFDKDGDGRRDEGFGTYDVTGVMEVWGQDILSLKAQVDRKEGPAQNRIFRWLQLINQGMRVPGVANTDAHTLFHQSGAVRNYVKSSTDDTTKIDEMEMVRESKKGHVVMSSGPFMEVGFGAAQPGDETRIYKGEGTLKVRVECANWLDVDRVQVLVNGRPDPALNFTRLSHPEFFDNGVVKFKREIPVKLARDSHLIVVATLEHERPVAVPVMGTAARAPTAISNPIYVDVDGNGFQHNEDILDTPLTGKPVGDQD